MEMKSLVLLLFCLCLLPYPEAGASPGIAGHLNSLRALDDYIENHAIDDGIDESLMDESDEEEETPLASSADAYCVDDSGTAHVWQAKAKKSKNNGKSKCGCSSGCGMIQKGLKPIIKKYVAAAAKVGISPVSCIRTQACQDRLRACYERCGQRGRAAKKSKHADGKACDFSKKDGKKLTALKKKTGLPIKRLTHGKEGGGLHEYQ